MTVSKSSSSNTCRVCLGIAVCLLLFFLINILVAGIFNFGLRRYYCLTPAKVLCLGYSMSEMGIDKLLLEDILQQPVAKYCMNGAGIGERSLMLKHYLETVKQKPKFVVYDVSPHLFSGGMALNVDALFYPFITESSAINQHLKQSMPTLEYWQKRLIPLSRYDDTRLGAVIRGFRSDWTTRSGKKFNPEIFRQRIASGNFKKISVDPEAIDALEETLLFLKEQNIRVILLALPNVDLLNQAEPEKYAPCMHILQNWAAKYEHVTFLDYNHEFSNQYELFVDPIHLNRLGQQKVTKKLAEYLTPLLQKSL